MKNSYAKEYYDTFLKQLPTDYKSARWFSSAEARLDYDQTKAVLVKSLGRSIFQDVLEVGPGDGVWTDLIIPKAKILTLLDQSIEMLNRAQERLKNVPDISFVHSDFLTYVPEKSFDLVFAIRCFEYFEDKDVALKQLSSLVRSGGKLMIVTKNPDHATMKRVQERELHTGQVSKAEMKALLEKAGFTLESTLSATWRFKAKYVLLRGIFRVLHGLHTVTNGFFKVPFLTEPLTESYLYVARKQ
jgi:ubiquinone/menaquinone biosynthesis C-methylase UbiE